MQAVDKRALKALLSTYWSPAGWKPEVARSTEPTELEHAKSVGMMFESPVLMDHDHIVEGLHDIIRQTSIRRVSDAFVASLSSRRLDLRSALGSYAVFQHMPPHGAVAEGRRCVACGAYFSDCAHDLNVMSFERWKWGGVRHDQPIYAYFDLNAFSKLEDPVPTAEDITIFREVLGAMRSADETVTSARLEGRIGRVLKSNKAERYMVIAILGFCGILKTPGHPSYTHDFVVPRDRELPDRRFVDMPYPACWWTGREGLDETEVRRYFGHFL